MKSEVRGPLEGILVLDFAQYLAGPSAALRLADLGARVVKVERPQGGDNGRRLVFKNLVSDGDGVLFHTINRNKESYTADLKDPEQLAKVKKLITQADVMIENFRPGIMERLGLGYEEVRKLNKGIIYGSVTGYGSKGPWVKRPGQDLLIQSLSGFVWLNGDDGQLPVPAALAMADAYTGIHLAEGILACLLRRLKTGEGGLVEVSLMESILDFQFEALTTYLNDGHQPPKRCKVHNAHPYLGAPYGIYPTADSCIALAMGSLQTLGQVLEIPELEGVSAEEAFDRRDELKALVEEKLKADTTAHWMEKLEEAGYWCSEVLDWKQLIHTEGFQSLDMLIHTGRPGCEDIVTTRCPIRIDGQWDKRGKWAPRLGEDTEKIDRDYGLNGEDA